MTQFIAWELYRQILEFMPIPCVDIAVVANGAVLLVLRDDAPAQGEWWLPGGRILKGEMMRDTAIRKARQEVGIECNVGMIGRFADDRDFQLYFVLKRAERFEGVRNALALAEIGGEQDAQRLVGRPAARLVMELLNVHAEVINPQFVRRAAEVEQILSHPRA